MITLDKKERGWVAIWRIIDEAPWYKNSKISHLAQHLIRKANHEDRYLYLNGERHFVKRGETITGRITLSEETGLTEQEIRHALKVLEEDGLLTVISTSRFSRLTICNYATYQDIAEKNTQPTPSRHPYDNHKQQ